MVFKRLREEIESICIRDPAARSWLEFCSVIRGCTCCFSIGRRIGRGPISGTCWGGSVSHMGKLATGIEIHPGAEIGERLFIDHGTGVVIGETAVVGDDVTLYQGVTLGGTSLHKGKRHPTVEDGVIIGRRPGLGPLTVGAGARIGANAVVLTDVPFGATMVGIPARMVADKTQDAEFLAYGCDASLPDRWRGSSTDCARRSSVWSTG